MRSIGLVRERLATGRLPYTCFCYSSCCCEKVLLLLLLKGVAMSLLRGDEKSLTVVTSPELILERGFFSRAILAVVFSCC